MEDTTTIILRFTDCGSDYKSWTLVCKRWRDILEKFFPEADVLFANPVKTLMKKFGYIPQLRSKWFSYEENIKIMGSNNLIVIEDVPGIDRIEALKKRIFFKSFISSSEGIKDLFYSGFQYLIRQVFEFGLVCISDEIVNFLIDSGVHFNEDIVIIIVDGIKKGYISLKCAEKIVDRTFLIYHKDFTKGERLIDNPYINVIVRQKATDYTMCYYSAGVSIEEIWEKTVINSDNFESRVYDFLFAIGNRMTLNYFCDVLYPMIPDEFNTNKENLMILALQACKYSWKDACKYCNSQEIFNAIIVPSFDL